ncbi:hypothetical protein QYF61_023137 [Mycteria americana]|uniref:Uncharacterized protein n=1 Tax=Mycteria americana TaxID=33587 RepID=A0AAN7S4D9_MYCAM|nr:hypothetical protein QYF61_023137 [Mycteria americana]
MRTELELFSLEKRRLRGDLIAAFQYLKGAYRKDGEGLFIRECSDRTREEILYDMGGETLNRLPREVVEVGTLPSLEVFKARLDGALSNLLVTITCMGHRSSARSTGSGGTHAEGYTRRRRGLSEQRAFPERLTLDPRIGLDSKEQNLHPAAREI